MNLRQAQRSLSELISKCEAAHVELPENPLEARVEAVESIIRSLKDGRPNLKDAQEELQQKFGIQDEWRQHVEHEKFKRLRRRQSNQKSVTIPQKKDVKLTQGGDGEFAQYQPSSTSSDSRTVTRTRVKQQVSRDLREELSTQETAAMKVATTMESSQNVVFHEASGDTEEKLPSASSENVIMVNHGESVLPGSPDQEMIDLLDDLDEDEDDEEDSDTSSDEDEEQGKVHYPNSS